MASDFLTLGRGEIYFAPFAPNTQTPRGYKFLGNCPAFNLNVSVEELNHMKSTEGFKEEDASVIVSRTVGGSVQTDDCKPANLAYFFLGSDNEVTQAAAAGLTETFTVDQGMMFRLGRTAANPGGAKAITVQSITDTEAIPTAFTVDIDYTVDSATGVISIVEGGNIADGTELFVTYDVALQTFTRVISGKQEIEGELWFKSRNAAGKNQDYILPYAKLRPEGDLALIGDEWTSFTMNVKGLTKGDLDIVYVDGRVLV